MGRVDGVCSLGRGPSEPFTKNKADSQHCRKRAIEVKDRKNRRPVILVLASCWLASACHAPKNSHGDNPSVVDAPTQIFAVFGRARHPDLGARHHG